MRRRYTKNAKGRLVKQADIYTKDEHGITREQIDKQAVAICNELIKNGGQAYIVGGAIRDLLLKREPKDWDIVTNEPPARIRKMFRHARVIGRRFKLVHVTGRSGDVFEVATFRALQNDDEGALFGTLEEDAFRRDFTLNALYYDVVREQIIDFHGGYQHIRARVIHPVVPLKHTFIEDPVRMIRAIKAAHTTQSRLTWALSRTIKSQVELLSGSSKSRLAEELLKALALFEAPTILRHCYDLGVLAYWLPEYHRYLLGLTKERRCTFWRELVAPDLPKNKRYRKVELRHITMYALFYPYLQDSSILASKDGELMFAKLKQVLYPLVFPNKDLIFVIRMIAAKEGLPSTILKEYEQAQRRRRTKNSSVAAALVP